MPSADLLIEFLSEELPPHNLENFAISFANFVNAKLESFKDSSSKIEYFASPRRFGCYITDVTNKEPSKLIQRRGPAVSNSLKDGVATGALLGFAKSCGVEWASLEQNSDGYFYYSYTSDGQNLEEVLPNILADALKQLPVAKMMRWGDTEYQFVRPLHNLLLTYDNKTICQDMQIMGLLPTNFTYGHRVMSHDKIIITKSGEYANILEKQGYVIASFAKRKEIITHQLNQIANKLQLQISHIDGLLDEVTSLVEYPVTLIGEFDITFLEVPQECLILSMAKNQKYFALVDIQGKLTNKFLFVANLESKDPQVIINGNQKVLSARLADAKFFYDVDKKHKLEFFKDKLANVVYHNKLGSQLDRVKRIQNIARDIAKLLNYSSDDTVRDTATIIKADLTTEMVGEFPELQGVMGKYYALYQGESAEAAKAIEEHYYPRFSGDKLPSSDLGIIMSLSDKLETLVGIWGIGLSPTGDKDPFALRRATLGVARILLQYPLNLQNLLEITSKVFDNADVVLNSNVVDEVFQFIVQRLTNYLTDSVEFSYPIDCVRSIFGARLELVSFTHMVGLLNKLQDFATNPNNKPIIEANKRIENILKKNPEEHNSGIIDEQLFRAPEEWNLYNHINQHPIKMQCIAYDNLDEYFMRLADFNKSVADFFDNVMVMDDNIEVRNNRLNLLRKLYTIMNYICKLSELSV